MKNSSLRDKNAFRIAHLSFVPDTGFDCVYEFQAHGRNFEVQRYCTGFSVPYFKSLIGALGSQVDAFAYSGLPPVAKIAGRSYFHSDYLEIMNQPSNVPVCDGYRVRELFTVNALIRRIEAGDIDPDQGIFFPLAVSHPEVVRMLRREYTERLYFADAASIFGLPWVVGPSAILQMAAPAAALALAFREPRKMSTGTSSARKRGAQKKALGQLSRARYLFADAHVLSHLGDGLQAIEGKELIVPVLEPKIRALLEAHKPAKIWELFPEPFRYAPQVNFAVVDAVQRLVNDRFHPLLLEEWERVLAPLEEVHPVSKKHLLRSRASTQQRVVKGLTNIGRRLRGSVQKEPDFAFVVHPLSADDIFRVPGIRFLRDLPDPARGKVEQWMSRAPGFNFGKIQHVVSESNGREVNGLIYAIGSTPKRLMQEDPQVTYRKIELICADAHRRGAKLLGLGAYTKIVGDAGLTIHRNSPIPVTTGNSLSASATLWAVYDVSARLGLIRPLPDGKRFDGTAVVIGATGSIGKVSSKLLSLAFPRLRLVAPRRERLEELAAEIRLLSPECDVQVTTDANEVAGDADVLITATSAFDQKVVDVERLKPGCVVCDCSRPLDFSLEDAMKRPDLLIIESGEVELPGPVRMTADLGLPGKSVYACLAETAVLAMEGRNEPFSMGRDLDWQRVKEIYRLARKHGVRLSAIRGHAGEITDAEIALVRELALKKRGKL